MRGIDVIGLESEYRLAIEHGDDKRAAQLLIKKARVYTELHNRDMIVPNRVSVKGEHETPTQENVGGNN